MYLIDLIIDHTEIDQYFDFIIPEIFVQKSLEKKLSGILAAMVS